jgi:hypothetical protein
VAAGALPLTDVVVTAAEEVEALDVLRGGPGWGSGVVVWCAGEAAWRRASALGWRGLERLGDGGDDDLVVERMAAAGAR